MDPCSSAFDVTNKALSQTAQKVIMGGAASGSPTISRRRVTIGAMDCNTKAMSCGVRTWGGGGDTVGSVGLRVSMFVGLGDSKHSIN